MNKCFLIVLFFSSAISLCAQQLNDEIRINEVFHRIPLSKALKKIQAKYHIKIAYDNARTQNITIDITLSNVTLSACFERLLQHTPLEFIVVDGTIIVIPKPPFKEGQPERHDFTIAGKIMDEITNETLPNAVIRVSGMNLATASNNDGYFALLHVPSDTLSIDISYVGYITRSIRLNKIENFLHFNVKLKDDTKILEEVILTDEYNQAIQIDDQAGKLAFNPKSIRSLPSLGEQDIFRTMQLMPGVNATDESSSGMAIRGMPSSYNLVLLDGITIYQQDHFFGAFSIVNADIVKDVRVSKGVFDPKYGGRTSGVIDITTKNGSATKPSFTVSANSISTKGTAEIPLSKKVSLFVAARRAFTDVFQSGLYKNLFNVASESNDQSILSEWDIFFGPRQRQTSYFFYDANAKLSYKPSDKDIISLSFYKSMDQVHLNDNYKLMWLDSVFGSSVNKSFTKWGNSGLSLRWGRQWNDKFYSNVRFSDSKFFRNLNQNETDRTDSAQLANSIELKSSIGDQTLAIDNEWLINDQFSFDFGFSNVHQKTNEQVNDFFELGPIQQSLLVNTWLTSAYGNITGKVTDKLSLSVGTRINYYQLNRQTYVEPRVTLQYKVNNYVNLKAAYGKSNQFINPVVYYGASGAISSVNESYWVLSNKGEGLPVVSSDHYTAGATLKSKGLIFDAELYYKSSTGIIILEDSTAGNNINYGLDVILQKTVGIYKGWLAYSLSSAKQSNPNFQGGKLFSSLQDQRHELKFVNTVMIGNWNFSSNLIYGSGKTYPAYKVNQYMDVDDLTASELILDNTRRPHLPAYYRLDVAVSYKFGINSHINYELGLSIFNVSDRQNIKTRKIDESKWDPSIYPTLSYIDVKLMGFTPSLFLNVSF